MEIQHTHALVDCSSSTEYEEHQNQKWFKYKEPLIHFQNCGLVDPRHIELIKIGTDGMTVGEVFALLKNQTEYTPLNYCMLDFIHKNPTDERIVPLLSKSTGGHETFFFGNMFENYRGEKWVLSFHYNKIGSPINSSKKHLNERWYPNYWNVAVIKNQEK